MKKFAYITLLDNAEYIYSVIACYSSWLKTKSNYPFYCACTKNVPTKILKNLEELNINILTLPELTGLEPLKEKLKQRGYDSWIPALAKLAIYGLEQFDKLIFLDADTYIYKNLDHLFEKPHLTGVPDGAGRKTATYKFVKGDNYFNKFNAGMFVLEPSEKLFKAITDLTQNLTIDRPWADQNIVSELYPDWPNEKDKQLPVYYNCFGRHICEYEQNIKDFSTDKIYVLHLVGKKLSPTYAFENLFNTKNCHKHTTYYRLIHNICLNVNKFIQEQQARNKLLDLKLVLIPEVCDLVVPYVDANDENWRQVFRKYNANNNLQLDNGEERFRGQGEFFRFFFRGIEKNVPWINNIFLLVQSKSQVPSWLDTAKIKVITHDQFIPKKYLPTFNSTTLEMFLWNIPGLSNHFLYANDDFFFLKELKYEDFFDIKQNKIKFNLTPLQKLASTVYDAHCRNNCIVSKLDKPLRGDHEYKPFIKDRLKEYYNKLEPELAKRISAFRTTNNCNCYLWLLLLYKNNLMLPSKVNCKYIRNYCKNSLETGDEICINDTDAAISIYEDPQIKQYFLNTFKDKSSYELNDFPVKYKQENEALIKKQKEREEEKKRDNRADGKSNAYLYF